MSTYTAQYTRPYTDGYKDRPDESTPEYARFINARDDALLRIETFLAALNIPSKLSDLVNDEGFINNTVSNLANYYLKTETYARTETYTQAEVQALIADAVSKVSGKLNILVVGALPTSDISTTTFYLVPKETAQEKNLYDEYINTDGTTDGWEFIGGVSTSIDLSNYYKKSEVDALLEGKMNKADIIPSKFEGTKAVVGNQVSSGGGGGSALHVYSTEEKVVATWVDGRPVYEKTYIGTGASTNSTNYFFDNDIENLDVIIESSLTAKITETVSQASEVPSMQLLGGNITISYVATTNKYSISQTQTSGSSTFDFNFTPRYTKTTDTATT